MDELKYTLFAVGTLAFLATLYQAVKHPELVDVPGQPRQQLKDAALRKRDDLLTWLMWGAWGLAAFVIFLDKCGVFDTLNS